MNREVFDRWCERGILALVLGILVFGPLAMGAVRSLEFLVIQGLAIGVMALWGVRLWISPKPQLLWPPLCWVVLAFMAYVITRYFTADVEYVARKELIHYLVYAFLFFAILNNLHRQESTQLITFTLVFLAMGISCYAVYQFFTGSDHVWHFITPYKGRGGGTYICPNHLAGFLEMLLPLALAYTLVGRVKTLTKIFLGYSALVMVAGLGATVSRAGWASCGISLVVFFCLLAMQRNRRLPALLMLAVLLSGGIFFAVKAEPLKKRFAGPSAPGLTELDLRYELWDAAVRMWQDHLWFGVGPGHYDTRFRAYRPIRLQMQPDRAHNEYINALADWGITGGAIIAAGIGVLLLSILKTWKYVRRSETEFGSGLSNKYSFVLGATIGLLALLLHSVLDFNMHIPANAILAFTLASLLTSHLRFATERYWSGARLWMKVSLSTALFAGVFYLGWQEVRLGREYVWLERAERASLKSVFSPAQAALLEKAHAAEPNNFETTYSIGECYRMRSFEGGENYPQLAQTAMDWYSRGMKLNPWDGYNYLRYGLCLDWLDRQSEAGPYINRADELDPNGYYMAAYIGWHYEQTGDYAAARTWFQRSILLQSKNNDIALSHVEITNQKLRRRASNQASPVER